MIRRSVSVKAFASVVYRWMLDQGYMVDDETSEVVAERVEQWDAEDLLQRLERDGFAIDETPVLPA